MESPLHQCVLFCLFVFKIHTYKYEYVCVCFECNLNRSPAARRLASRAASRPCRTLCDGVITRWGIKSKEATKLSHRRLLFLFKDPLS